MLIYTYDSYNHVAYQCYPIREWLPCPISPSPIGERRLRDDEEMNRLTFRLRRADAGRIG